MLPEIGGPPGPQVVGNRRDRLLLPSLQNGEPRETGSGDLLVPQLALRDDRVTRGVNRVTRGRIGRGEHAEILILPLVEVGIGLGSVYQTRVVSVRADALRNESQPRSFPR